MSVDSMSQKQRILRLAYAREDEGITAVDFQLPAVADGGRPILRVAARIKDLENEGIHFTDGGTRNRCKVYVLDRASLVDATKPPTGGGHGSLAASTSGPPADSLSSYEAGGTGALFHIGQAQQSAVYDPDWSDAA